MNESKVNNSHQQRPGGGLQPVNDPTASITQSCSGFLGGSGFYAFNINCCSVEWGRRKEKQAHKNVNIMGG